MAATRGTGGKSQQRAQAHVGFGRCTAFRLHTAFGAMQGIWCTAMLLVYCIAFRNATARYQMLARFKCNLFIKVPVLKGVVGWSGVQVHMAVA